MTYRPDNFAFKPKRRVNLPVLIAQAVIILAGLCVYLYYEVVDGMALTAGSYLVGVGVWTLVMMLIARATGEGWTASTVFQLTAVWALLVVVYFMPWTPVKVFQMKLSQVEKGMTPEEVNAIMQPYKPSKYQDDTYWVYRPASSSYDFRNHAGELLFRRGKVREINYTKQWRP
ncbi:MAG: hypothetical protein AAGD01_11555 [Acidobacteriota bacterium]